MEVYNRYNGSREDPTQHEKDLLDKVSKLEEELMVAKAMITALCAIVDTLNEEGV